VKGRMRAREGHSRTGERRGRVKLEQQDKAHERGTLTVWGAQNEGKGQDRKESEEARGTHFLESTEGGTSESSER
jgi:hypothetical protein